MVDRYIRYTITVRDVGLASSYKEPICETVRLRVISSSNEAFLGLGIAPRLCSFMKTLYAVGGRGGPSRFLRIFLSTPGCDLSPTNIFMTTLLSKLGCGNDTYTNSSFSNYWTYVCHCSPTLLIVLTERSGWKRHRTRINDLLLICVDKIDTEQWRVLSPSTLTLKDAWLVRHARILRLNDHQCLFQENRWQHRWGCRMIFLWC